MSAGIRTPASAARIGSLAILGSDNAPWRNSWRISSPTTRKKIVMSPSSIQKCRGRAAMKSGRKAPGPARSRGILALQRVV